MAKATEDQKRQVFELSNEGFSDAEIARRVGLHRSSVLRMRRVAKAKKGGGSANEMMAFRVSPSEIDRFETISRSHGFRSKSEGLRSLVRRAGGYFEADPEVEIALKEIKSNLQRVGGNLNQIARDLSISVKKIGKADLKGRQIAQVQELEDEVHALRGVIVALLGRSQERADAMAARLNEGDL